MTLAPREVVEAPAREWDRYPEYKDSGIEWIGDVPAHWSLERLKAVVSAPVKKGYGVHRSFVALEHIRAGSGLLVDGYEPEVVPADDYALFEEGDILFGKLRPYLRKYWLAPFSGCCPTELLVLRPRGPVFQRRFLNYVVGSSYFVAVANATSYGVKMPRTSWEIMGAQPILIPSPPEQRAIAIFLDRETQKIDDLISKREHLIELLEEKRTALISRAVTKGLDPDAPMKDSGVEWLGEIPEHWDAVQIRNVAESLQTGPFGSQLHSDDYVSDGIPVINPSHLRNGRIDPDSDCAVDQETRLRLQRHELRKGDIIFARRGELGRCALVTNREQGWICGTGSLRARPRKHLAEPTFLNLALSTGGVKDWLVLESVGATMDNLNTSILARLPLPLPPTPEQRQIVASINQETNKIDALAGKVREHIEKLREYRTALISAAVTGRIDVREEASAPADREPDKMTG